MRLIDAEQKILSLNQLVVQTRDVSALLKISLPHANKILTRLTASGRFVRLMRGKWATHSKIDPLILPELLTAPFPSYISLQTALFFHGMISQIPETIYAVSLARAQVYKTPLSIISIHHIQPDFFFGFEVKNQIKIASPEKALIDLFYLTPAKSNLFRTLPELEIHDSFNFKKAKQIINLIPSPRTRKMVDKRLEDLEGRK